MRVGVFGLGKLGSPMLAVFAAAGHDVLGCDLIRSNVDSVNAFKAPVQEPGLQDMLDHAKGHYSATLDADAVARWANLIFIVVPTPSMEDDTFTPKYVVEVCNAIGPAIGDCPDYKTVVVVSTVMPGTMQSAIIPALESASRNQCGLHFGVAYNPEFIALGSVIENMLHPDFVLIGCQNDVSLVDIINFYKSVYSAHGVPIAPFQVARYVDAEIAKLALNCYVTTKISYANEIAGLCECIRGADAANVLRIVGADSRVGKKYLTPATSFGGPCFPRDSRAMAALGKSVRYPLQIPQATKRVNNKWPVRMADHILKCHPKTVAILGASYKPYTGIATESAATLLLRELFAYQCAIRLYDPMVPDAAMRCMTHVPCVSNYYHDNIDKCVAGADVVVIATAWPEFRTLKINHPCHVYDCWRILDPDIQGDGVKLHYCGRNEE